MSYHRLQKELFALARDESYSLLKKGDISRAASKIIACFTSDSFDESTERAATASREISRDAAASSSSSSAARNGGNFVAFQLLLHKWKTSSALQNQQKLLAETSAVFDKIAAELVMRSQRQENTADADVGDGSGVLAQCRAVWVVMAERASSDAIFFLTTCLQFVATSESSLTVDDEDDEPHSHTSTDEEDEHVGEHWFESATALSRIFMKKDAEKRQQLLPTEQLREVSSDSFWSNLRSLVQCIESSQRLILRTASASTSTSTATSAAAGSNSIVDSHFVKPICDALLLRIDFHFGGSGGGNDGDQKKKKKTKSPLDSNSNSGEDFSHRPEHLLQYIGTQWILLQLLSSKLTPPRALSSSSCRLNHSTSDDRTTSSPPLLSHVLQRTFSSGASSIFNRICIALIVATLEQSAATPLLDLIKSAAVKVATTTTTTIAAANKKKGKGERRGGGGGESDNDDDEDGAGAEQDGTSTTVDQKRAQVQVESLLGGNVRLLHVLNVLSEMVKQLQRSEKMMTLSDASYHHQQQHHHHRAAHLAISYPCLDLLADSSSTGAVPAALIASMRDYCVGVIETQRSNNRTPLQRVVNMAHESSWEQLVSAASFGDSNSSKQPTSQLIVPATFLLAKKKNSINAAVTAGAGASNNNNGTGPQSSSSSADVASGGGNQRDDNNDDSDDDGNGGRLLVTLGQMRRPETVGTCAALVVSLCKSVAPILRALASTSNISSSSSSAPPIFTSLFIHVVLRETVLSMCATSIAQNLASLGSQFIGAAAAAATAAAIATVGERDECIDHNNYAAQVIDPSSLHVARVLAALVVKVCVPLLELESLALHSLPRFLERECCVPRSLIAQLIVDPCTVVFDALRGRIRDVMTTTRTKERREKTAVSANRGSGAADVVPLAEQQVENVLRVPAHLVRSVVATCAQRLLLPEEDYEAAAATGGGEGDNNCGASSATRRRVLMMLAVKIGDSVAPPAPRPNVAEATPALVASKYQEQPEQQPASVAFAPISSSAPLPAALQQEEQQQQQQRKESKPEPTKPGWADLDDEDLI